MNLRDLFEAFLVEEFNLEELDDGDGEAFAVTVHRDVAVYLRSDDYAQVVNVVGVIDQILKWRQAILIVFASEIRRLERREDGGGWQRSAASACDGEIGRAHV